MTTETIATTCSGRPMKVSPNNSVQRILEALIYNPEKHPERSNATPARVSEVLGVVVAEEKKKSKITSKCEEAISRSMESYEPLAPSEGELIARLLSEGLSLMEAELATAMIEESELSTNEVVELHKKYKIPVSKLEDDLLPVSGCGAKIGDSKGNTLVDLDSNYSATNLGNANREIAQGLYNQASTLISQKEDRVQVARARFLKEIKGMLPQNLSCFYWQNSGGEAVDKALKIAKAATGQTGVIAFEGSFHGRTHGAIAVTHNIEYRKPFGLDKEAWVHFVPYNDADAVEKVLSEGKAKIVILEMVQGEEAGIRPATPEFAKRLRTLCDKWNAVLIADEVQTGFARVSNGEGKWFASQVVGIEPDIMVIGKSFGGGYPVTAVVTTPAISEKMKPGFDGSTFGGNPMAMTAALIATRQMRALNLPKAVAERSRQFDQGLKKIKSPLMKGYRACGLMIGIELDSRQCVKDIQAKMKALGAHSSLSSGAIMRWMPPLVITEAEVNIVLSAFEKAIKDA